MEGGVPIIADDVNVVDKPRINPNLIEQVPLVP